MMLKTLRLVFVGFGGLMTIASVALAGPAADTARSVSGEYGDSPGVARSGFEAPGPVLNFTLPPRLLVAGLASPDNLADAAAVDPRLRSRCSASLARQGGCEVARPAAGQSPELAGHVVAGNGAGGAAKTAAVIATIEGVGALFGGD
jgi:hypothetical protein